MAKCKTKLGFVKGETLHGLTLPLSLNSCSSFLPILEMVFIRALPNLNFPEKLWTVEKSLKNLSLEKR